MTPVSKEFAEDFIKVQDSIEGAKRAKENTFFKNAKGAASKYADLTACWEACRDALHDNGFAVLQFPIVADPGYVGLETILLHRGGESIGRQFYVPMKDATSAQQMGSAITYARRYALCAVVGICPEDDDGNAASKAPAAKKEPKVVELWTPIDADFDKAKMNGDVDGMKTAYTRLRNSSCPEPTKTHLLKEYAIKIKEMSGGN